MSLKGLMSVGIIGTFLITSIMFIGSDTSSAYPLTSTQLLAAEEHELIDFLVEFENTTKQLRPRYYDSTSETVFFINGTQGLATWNETDGYQDVHSFADTFYSIEVPSDGSWVATNGSWISRSDDYGNSWDAVQALASGYVGWRTASSDANVYVGEYKTGTVLSSDLWYSDDNGATWATVASSRTLTSGTSHIHVVEVDPYTDDVFFAYGDTKDGIARSTDGTTFEWWGPSIQPTSIAFDANNIYWGDDPYGRIWTYNRTTEEFSESAHFEEWYPYNTPEFPVGGDQPVWDMAIGDDGVIYAAIYNNQGHDCPSGIRISLNGVDWGTLWISGDGGVAQGAEYLVGPDVNGNMWFKDMKSGGYTWTFPDLTREQAEMIIYTPSPRTVDESWSYDGGLAEDNKTTYLYLGQDVIEDAVLTVTGVKVQNFCNNPGFESTEDWATSTNWRLYPSSGQTNNISAEQSTDKVWDGTYSGCFQGYNSTALHGYIESTKTLSETLPAGTVIYYSFYYSMNGTNATAEYYGHNFWPKCYIRYTDVTYLTAPATYVYDNTAPGWTRFVINKTMQKAVDRINVRIEVYGQLECYIDDIQVQTDILSPFVNGTQNSTNIVTTVDGQAYYYNDTLDDGDTWEVSLGTLSGGPIPIEFNVGGSKVVEWSITGTRAASITNAYGEVTGGVFVFEDVFDNATVEVFTSLSIDASSWLGITAGTLGVSTNARVNVTISAWGDIPSWDADNNNTVSVTYTLSGLDSSLGYKVYQDGVVITTGTGPSFSFTATGGGEFEVVVWNTKTVSTLVVLTINMVGLGIMASVAFGWVLPFTRDIKNGRFRSTDQMVKELIHGVVFIVVGCFMYVMLYQVAIG